MMPLRWKLFRAICIVQMIAAALNLMDILFHFFLQASWGGILGLALFFTMVLLTITAVNLLNNNYPDEPLNDIQKKNFNRLFLVNFLLLSILFGFVFSEINSLIQLAKLTGKNILRFSSGVYLMLFIYIMMLIFQFLILYGMVKLRFELSANFLKRKFEFEET